MRNISLVVLFLLLAALPSYSAIVLIDPDTTNHSPNTYHSIMEAHDAANIGDTIYVKGCATPYVTSIPCRISKRLVWIGPGFDLSQSSGTQADTNSAVISPAFNFYAGSEGSVVEGLTFKLTSYSGSSYMLLISRPDLTIRRCSFYYFGGAHQVAFAGSGITVEQCDFTRAVMDRLMVYVYGTNQVIRNNLFNYCEIDSTVNGVSVYNNTFTYFAGMYGGNIFNNVFLVTALTTPSANFYHNVSTGYIGTTNGNVSYLTEVSLIQGGTHFENKYRLNPSSIANTAGVGGVACGAFGGTTPYVNSGMPSIPSISSYSSFGHATPTSGLSVTIQATAHP